MMDIVDLVCAQLKMVEAENWNVEFASQEDCEAIARAAIAAVFDWLGEPSEAALEYDSKSATDQRDAWLASMRAEALTTACRIE